MTSQRARFEREIARVAAQHCSHPQADQDFVRIARAAFVAGWVARGRNFYTISSGRVACNRLRRLDARTAVRAWEGKG